MMQAVSWSDGQRNRQRAGAAFGVAVSHALLGYALLTGLGFDMVREAGAELKIFDVKQDEPAAEKNIPLEEAAQEEEEGAASAPNLRAQPSPIVAPPPRIRLDVPSRLVTVPEASPVPPGNDNSAGAADIAGPGSGNGGQGIGTGSGGQGSGSGSGGARRARRESGALVNEDYPRAAKAAGTEGSVTVLFTVRRNGRVGGCRVTRSSGNMELDSTTCRLIEQRFRYFPATDYQGRAIPELQSFTYDWLLPFKRGASRR